MAGQRHAHHWTDSNVESLVQFAKECADQDHLEEKDPSVATAAEATTLCGALTVLCCLVECLSIHKLPLLAHSESAALCHSCCYSRNFKVAARSCKLLTLLATSSIKAAASGRQVVDGRS